MQICKNIIFETIQYINNGVSLQFFYWKEREFKENSNLANISEHILDRHKTEDQGNVGEIREESRIFVKFSEIFLNFKEV